MKRTVTFFVAAALFVTGLSSQAATTASNSMAGLRLKLISARFASKCTVEYPNACKSDNEAELDEKTIHRFYAIAESSNQAVARIPRLQQEIASLLIQQDELQKSGGVGESGVELDKLARHLAELELELRAALNRTSRFNPTFDIFNFGEDDAEKDKREFAHVIDSLGLIGQENQPGDYSLHQYASRRGRALIYSRTEDISESMKDKVTLVSAVYRPEFGSKLRIIVSRSEFYKADVTKIFEESILVDCRRTVVSRTFAGMSVPLTSQKNLVCESSTGRAHFRFKILD